MKSFPAAIVLFAALVAGLVASQVQAEGIYINSYSYAAVAYSPSTGEMHYSYNYGSRAAAERAALARCSASDAKIVCWVNDGFCALAIADDGSYNTGWSWGSGASNTDAIYYAREDFRKEGKNARIAICLSSDGQSVYKQDN